MFFKKSAEKEIAKAKRERATELSLWNLGLTKLPESIGQLTALTWLGLTNMQAFFGAQLVPVGNMPARLSIVNLHLINQ